MIRTDSFYTLQMPKPATGGGAEGDVTARCGTAEKCLFPFVNEFVMRISASNGRQMSKKCKNRFRNEIL